MTHPTTLSPWYVLALVNEGGELEYFTTVDTDLDEPPKFSLKKRDAMLFLNLNTAKRTRDSEPGSFLIVLASKEDLQEYGR